MAVTDPHTPRAPSVAADALCIFCDKPGIKWAGPYSADWCCDDHAWSLDRDPEADAADMRAKGEW